MNAEAETPGPLPLRNRAAYAIRDAFNARPEASDEDVQEWWFTAADKVLSLVASS